MYSEPLLLWLHAYNFKLNTNLETSKTNKISKVEISIKYKFKFRYTSENVKQILK